MYFWFGIYIFFLGLIYSFFGSDFGFNIFGDQEWYLRSGLSLLSGDFQSEYLFFSPFHSLLIAIHHLFESHAYAEIYLAFSYLARLLFALFLGACISSFASIIYELRLLSSRSVKALCFLLMSSPYVVRYSYGIHPEYFSLCAGLLLVSRLLCNSNVLKKDMNNSRLNAHPINNGFFSFSLTSNRFVDRLLRLNDFFFISLLLALCFFRYSLVLVIPAYMISSDSFRLRRRVDGFIGFFAIHIRRFFGSTPFRYSPKYSDSTVKFLGKSHSISFLLLFIGSILLSIFLGLIFNLSFGRSSLNGFSFCGSFQSLLLLLGFREAFWTSSCLINFDPVNFHASFLSDGIVSGNVNFYGSLLLGFINMFVSILGLLGVFIFAPPQISKFVGFALLGLFVIVMFLGIGHYRYMMPIVPSIYLGLFLLLSRRRRML